MISVFVNADLPRDGVVAMRAWCEPKVQEALIRLFDLSPRERLTRITVRADGMYGEIEHVSEPG